jgi:uncharacterized membrane protein
MVVMKISLLHVIIAWLGIFLFLLPITTASEEDYHINIITVTIDLQTGDEHFYVKLTSKVDGLKFFDFAFHLPLNAVTSSGESMKVEELGIRKRIYFPQPLKAGESIAFTMSTVEKVDINEGAYFYKGFTTPYDVDTFRLMVIFPEGVLPEIRTFNRTLPNCCSADTFHRSTSLPPDGVSIQGDRVTLMWERSLKAGERFEVGIHLPEKEGPNYFLISTLLIASLTFLVGFHYAKRKRKVEVANVFLNEEERAIVEFIRSQGGEVLQETIWKSEVLPFSRPKVSRIISELEARGLIVREPYKKTFKVKLNV